MVYRALALRESIIPTEGITLVRTVEEPKIKSILPQNKHLGRRTLYTWILVFQALVQRDHRAQMDLNNRRNRWKMACAVSVPIVD